MEELIEQVLDVLRESEDALDVIESLDVAAVIGRLPDEATTDKDDVYADTVEAIPMSVIDDIKEEIKGWYWQADKQALAKDPCVVDAMVDLFVRTIYKHVEEVKKW